MAVTLNAFAAQRLSAAVLEPWRRLPVAVIGDELGRSQLMQVAIKPVAPGMGFVGQAVTVRGPAGGNLALHHALALCFPGSVLVADAGGQEDTAVWGGILHRAAAAKGVAAVVVDGAMRDVAELRDSGLPAYCRAIAPAGPANDPNAVSAAEPSANPAPAPSAPPIEPPS